MVEFLASYASQAIEVLAAQVSTTITIVAPASVTQGVPFNVSGRLTRDDTGQGIAGMSVYVYYDSTALGGIAGGMGTTDADGYYSIDGQIDEAGSWMLSVNFYGATVGGLSMAPAYASRYVGMAGVESIMPLLVVVGLGLLAMQR